jgi:hypothetical protein
LGVTPIDRAQIFRRRAEECEREAAQVTRIAEVRQFRLLAQAWRELADSHETPAAEPRTFDPQA